MVSDGVFLGPRQAGGEIFRQPRHDLLAELVRLPPLMVRDQVQLKLVAALAQRLWHVTAPKTEHNSHLARGF